jgi:aspartate beta-hydroxylase
VVNFYASAGDHLRRIYGRRIETPAVLDVDEYFPRAKMFAAEWRSLRDEAIAIAATLDRVPRLHEIMREQSDISAHDGRDWRMFVVKEYGATVRRNLSRCPKLATLLDKCAEALSACFSYLAPGEHIPVHRGPFRGVSRFHLALSMSRDAKGDVGATLWVDGAPYRLDDGDTLLWDDTFPHEVLNATDVPRVALLLDVWRPGMPADLAALSCFIVGVVGMFAYIRQDAFIG